MWTSSFSSLGAPQESRLSSFRIEFVARRNILCDSRLIMFFGPSGYILLASGEFSHVQGMSRRGILEELTTNGPYAFIWPKVLWKSG